jgi:hypothetical protein
MSMVPPGGPCTAVALWHSCPQTDLKKSEIERGGRGRGNAFVTDMKCCMMYKISKRWAGNGYKIAGGGGTKETNEKFLHSMCFCPSHELIILRVNVQFC